MRISVTALDGYRYFMNSEMTPEAFLTRLYGEDTFGEPAQAGIAFHKLVEDIHFGRQPSWELFHFVGEYTLPRFDVMEMPIMRRYGMNGEITLSGRVDGTRGFQIVDIKTGKSPDLERLTDSFQWRAYLAMMPEMETFRFDAFQLKINKRKPHGGGRWEIHDHRVVMTQRYPGLEADVHQIVAEYSEVLRDLASNGLIGFDDRGRPCRPEKAAVG